MHLWSYESLDERRRLRAALMENRAWVEDYLPVLRPQLVRQDIRLMNAFSALQGRRKTGATCTNCANYRTQVGRVREWAGHFADVMPARERHSRNVCAWVTEAGQPNEVCHLWAYPDLNARASARAAAGRDPDWRAFLGKSAHLIVEAHSTILVPVVHSPLQ